MACFFSTSTSAIHATQVPESVPQATPRPRPLGAFFGVWLMGFDNNVYVQIGNIMLIGLGAKNAILIVEFAKMKREEGLDATSAAIEAAKLRLRPIIMTSLAFVLGVIGAIALTGAVRALESGQYLDAVGPSLAAAFVLLTAGAWAWRRGRPALLGAWLCFSAALLPSLPEMSPPAPDASSELLRLRARLETQGLFDAARKRIALAQKKRWAEYRKQKAAAAKG